MYNCFIITFNVARNCNVYSLLRHTLDLYCTRYTETFQPSGPTVALGSTQPLTEMITRNISWGGGGLNAADAWG
jgi:hypothetical protein